MEDRIEEVDVIVRERIVWVDRDIAGGEESIEGYEELLAKAKAKLVKNRLERARLREFLGEDV
jgi:hypothetical protein